jgi:hypothetical protein
LAEASTPEEREMI